MVVGGYWHEGATNLHHVVFTRTLAPEPNGTSECRNTWTPMYVAGAGDSSLEFPRNTAHKLPAGTQLLSQLHLFNASDDQAKVSLEAKGTIESTCAVSDEVDIFAAFPHMHTLGTGLTFRAGSSLDRMTTVYQRVTSP